ncbi:hypothetical protein AMS68_004530 [Peltaster fructicola]|uniref:Cytochrome P450 n=1 Tax=Peltaster fructicola TaxID=286661 RepID=A0A6H0XW87_9PEZI|nr:hypothetical protein AMS68_004530 [Peltaster fructicola]
MSSQPDPFDILFSPALLYSWISSHVVLVVAMAVIAIAITTRFQVIDVPQSQKTRNAYAPTVPYWFPILGHIPNMVWDATQFMRSKRDQYVDGAYSLNFGGTVHTIVYKPSLVTALLNAKDSSASAENVADYIGEKVFGFPLKKEGKKYYAANEEIRNCYHHLLSETRLGDMVRRTAQTTKENVVNLVSFSKSPVDQSYWERTAKAQLTVDKNGEEVVAANMLDLIRDFCALASNPSILGTDLVNNYPGFLADMWTFDRAFLYLGAGLPRWVPIPLVTRAHIARRNLIRAFSEFEQAMDDYVSGKDPGPKWQNLDDVGAVIRARIDVYRKYDFSMAARASFDLGLTWATNANSNMLVFWMLNRAYADTELAGRLREEIAPYVQAVQPKQTLAVAEAPRLQKFDVDGICSQCPLLKSCYVECLRVDAATWSFKQVKEDFELNPREKAGTTYMLRKGEYIHAAHDLHNTNPAYFPQPEAFQADRHVKIDENGRRTADLGTIRPYGGGSSMCKGRFFAYKECMVFAAAILAMWDIEPVGGGAWKMPKPRKSTGVYGTEDPTRVWLRRRPLPTR